MRSRISWMASMVAVVLLAACSGGGAGDAGGSSESAAADAAEEGVAASGATASAYGDGDVAVPASGEAGGAGAGTAAELRSSTTGKAPVDVADADLPEAPKVPDPAAVGAGLRAGSVDDNARFADYLDYRRRFAETGIEVHDRDVRERHVIRVLGTDGAPVLGAQITLSHEGRVLQAVRTHADGRALLHPLVTEAPKAESYTVDVTRGAATAQLTLSDRSVRNHEVVLKGVQPAAANRLDIHFLIDATGSMADEIDRLKATMAQVATRITTLPARPEVRWGMTAYRDRGEAFVTRTTEFTTDLRAFTEQLATLQAADGGDPPEALNEALHAAVHEPDWDSDNAVQIIFLIADAAPHLDYADDEDYAVDMFVAAERGITIVPIASSGMDDQGEYVFRQLAQVSFGRFMFLTYGPDGQPGDSTTHDVEGYEVLSLDELVVRYVAEQLAHREPREAQQ